MPGLNAAVPVDGLPGTFAVSLPILLPVSLAHGGLFAVAGWIHG